MRMQMLVALMASVALPVASIAQTDEAPERGTYVTVFRSPATGIELRAGRAAAFVGLYPTIVSRDGARDHVNFVRTGVTYYHRPRGVTAYASPSLVWSLDRDWRSGTLTEAGVRAPLFRGVSGRLGAAVLATFDGEVRVNPTIGLDVRIGGRTGAGR